jgi:hypothetical protein
MAISSRTDALKLAPTGFSLSGSTAGVYDPTKPVLSVNSSILKIGTGVKGITIDGSGKIKQYGSELDIGTEIANVFINEYSVTISSDNLVTSINTASAVFSGNVSIAGTLTVNGSSGSADQVLGTDGTSLYWTTNGLDLAVDQTFGANLTVAGTLAPAIIDIIDVDNNEFRLEADISTYTANTLEKLTLSANSLILISNDAFVNSTMVESSYINIGNSTVNSTINSSSFSGRANNTLYVGSVTAADVVSNAQLSANLANYVTSASLSSTVSTLPANSATYLNGKTESNLNVNSATNALNANNASYLGTVAASSYVNTSGSYTLSGVITHVANIVVNGAIIAAGVPGTAGQVLTSNGSGNVYWSTVTSGTGGGSYTFSTGLTNTSDTITVNSAYIATLTANNAGYLGGVISTSYVTATNLSDNLVNYAAASSITANAATAYTNAAIYADNKAGTAYSNAVSYVDSKGYITSVPAAYVQNTDSRTLSGNLYFTGANSYFGGKVTHAANIILNAGISIIDSLGNQGTAGQILTSNGAGNVYWSTVTSGGTGSVTSIASGNGLFGGPITSSGTLYVLANSGIVSNTTGVFVNSSYIATLAANSAAYLGALAASSYVTATNLSDNLANYSTTTATTSNAATAYSNASLYTDNRILTVNSSITSNSATAYSNAMADTLSRNGTYTGNNIFNGTNTVINSNTTIVGNSNFTGANIYFSGKTTHAANIVLNTGISIIDSTGIQGTAGQVLTSNGSGNVYWSTVSGGGGSWAGGTMANSVLFSNTTSSVNATSGAVVITGGLGVNNNIYTAGRVGFANSSTSVAYSYYNAVTDSIDTVFG